MLLQSYVKTRKKAKGGREANAFRRNQTSVRVSGDCWKRVEPLRDYPTNTPASVVNVTTHGHSSPVNVGSGTQTQQINTADGMGELDLALTSLLDAMKDHPQLTEVREIVIEAKDEAGKPAPSKLRLRSILGGIKDGLQGVAALHPLGNRFIAWCRC